jgi:four helix bundle protein
VGFGDGGFKPQNVKPQNVKCKSAPLLRFYILNFIFFGLNCAKNMKSERVRYDLEERLINFAVQIIMLAQRLPASKIGTHLEGQLNRSGTAPALIYGEAQAAESNADFIHKMKICLKELRESQINLKIIIRASLLPEAEVLPVLDECSQLVAIFTSSIKTAALNRKM